MVGILTAVVVAFIVVAFVAYTIGTANAPPIAISSPTVQFDGPAAADFSLLSSCGADSIQPGDSGWSCVITVQNLGSIAHSVVNVTIGGQAEGVLIDVETCVLHGPGCLPASVSAGGSVSLYLSSYVLNDGGGSYALTVFIDCGP